LDILVGFELLWQGLFIQVFEFVLDVRGPGDVGFIDSDLFQITTIFMVKLVCVVENTLSNKTTWNSWPLWLERFIIDTFLLVQPEVTNLDNWVAV